MSGAIANAPDMQSHLVGQHGGLSDSHFTSSIPLVQTTLGPNILLVALLGWNIGINATASHGRAQAMSARAYALLGAEAHARVLAGGII